MIVMIREATAKALLHTKVATSPSSAIGAALRPLQQGKEWVSYSDGVGSADPQDAVGVAERRTGGRWRGEGRGGRWETGVAAGTTTGQRNRQTDFQKQHSPKIFLAKTSALRARDYAACFTAASSNSCTSVWYGLRCRAANCRISVRRRGSSRIAMSCFARPVVGRPTRRARVNSSSDDSGMSLKSIRLSGIGLALFA